MINLLIYVILPLIFACVLFWCFKNFYIVGADSTFHRMRMPRLVAILIAALAFAPVANIALAIALLMIWPFAEADKDMKLSLFTDISGKKPEEVFGPEPTFGERIINWLVGNLWKEKKKS